MSNKHRCSPQDAAKMKDWIANRGGILIWHSINLANMGASWTTPARDTLGNPTTKPTWESADKPSRHITSADEVEVTVPREVKRFHVAVRRSGNGLSLKVTDGGSRRIRAAVEKAGDGAWHGFDFYTQEAVIYVPGEVVPLNEWREPK